MKYIFQIIQTYILNKIIIYKIYLIYFIFSNDIIYNLTTNIPQLDNIDVEIDKLHNILDKNEII